MREEQIMDAKMHSLTSQSNLKDIVRKPLYSRTPFLKIKRKITLNFIRRKPNRKTKTKIIDVSKAEISPDISIPGINKLCDQNYTAIGKVIWGFAILASMGVCFSQISNRIELYMRSPYSITVNLTRINRLPFPGVTICPFYPFLYNPRISELKERFAMLNNITFKNKADIREKIFPLQLLDLPDMNATNLWKLGGIPDEYIKYDLLCNQRIKENCQIKILKSHTYFFFGICTVLRFAKKIQFDGSYNGLDIILDTPKYDDDVYWTYTVTLHEWNDLPKHSLYSNIGHLVHPNRETNIEVFLKQYIHVFGSSANPCQGRKEYQNCIWNCIEERLSTGSHCRLPYSDNASLPLCENSTSAQQFANETEKLYKSKSLCPHCIRKCQDDMYSMIPDVVTEKNITWLKILMRENVVEVVQEKEYYTIGSLVADIGSNLGLFLGFCILTVMQIAETFTVKLIKYCIGNSHLKKRTKSCVDFECGKNTSENNFIHVNNSWSCRFFHESEDNRRRHTA